jgi:hypothetical protein
MVIGTTQTQTGRWSSLMCGKILRDESDLGSGVIIGESILELMIPCEMA